MGMAGEAADRGLCWQFWKLILCHYNITSLGFFLGFAIVLYVLTIVGGTAVMSSVILTVTVAVFSLNLRSRVLAVSSRSWVWGSLYVSCKDLFLEWFCKIWVNFLLFCWSLLWTIPCLDPHSVSSCAQILLGLSKIFHLFPTVTEGAYNPFADLQHTQLRNLSLHSLQRKNSKQKN